MNLINQSLRLVELGAAFKKALDDGRKGSVNSSTRLDHEDMHHMFKLVWSMKKKGL